MRILKKRYLLRFKGFDILAHIMTIATVFALMNALTSIPGDSFSGAERLLRSVASAWLIAAVTYLPLRALYRFIQRQSLVSAVIISLLVAGGFAFLVTYAIAVYYPELVFVPFPWPPENPLSAAIRMAMVSMLGYALVIQIAVSARRERMARRANVSNRIKALQARIRPHFFFNTLNSVASLIRSDPDSAEKAIEDLAGVFRVVIRADQRLVSLAEEIEIARQYMSIEKLRLGERLEVEWHMAEEVMTATLPSLTLQPLLENAVYHGIEPSMRGGTITIDCSSDDGRLHILVTNPVTEFRVQRSSGNKVALKNIKERLQRQFGGDVRINIHNTSDRFNVSIDAPLVHARPTR